MWDENGLQISIISAGFIGGIISLALVRDLTPFRAMMTVCAGTACATYLTPIAMHYSKLGPGSEHALAFILGVTGMNAVAGFFKLSESFANAPISSIGNMQGKSKSKEKEKNG